ETAEKELAVTDSFAFSNQGKTTYYDPAAGAVQAWIPEAAKDSIRVTVIGPNNLPLQRGAEPAGKPNTYKVDFPVKPGETRIDFNYRLPFSSPGRFATRILQKGVPTRLVAPQGIQIQGEGLEDLGREPRSQAQIFGVKASSIEVEVQGAGSMRAAEAASEDEDAGPGIQQILPRLYDRVYYVMALGVLILALGFALLYRRS
ncbi:MAG: hypothetical protein HY822_02285, partial [Acidobacteria bacterium]|nr:hypothetical protein [Acidobacteriota bacterium]